MFIAFTRLGCCLLLVSPPPSSYIKTVQTGNTLHTSPLRTEDSIPRPCQAGCCPRASFPFGARPGARPCFSLYPISKCSPRRHLLCSQGWDRTM